MGRPSDANRRLVRAAIELISAQGYAAVSVTELCDAAGVSKSSFYHYFPSKRALAAAALKDHWRRFERGILEPALRPDIPPSDRVLRLLEMASRLQRADKRAAGRTRGSMLGNLAAELGGQNEPLSRLIAAIFDRYAARLAGTAGEMPRARGAMSVDAAGAALAAYVEGLHLLARAANDPDLIEQLSPAAIDIVTGTQGARSTAD